MLNELLSGWQIYLPIVLVYVIVNRVYCSKYRETARRIIDRLAQLLIIGGLVFMTIDYLFLEGSRLLFSYLSFVVGIMLYFLSWSEIRFTWRYHKFQGRNDGS